MLGIHALKVNSLIGHPPGSGGVPAQSQNKVDYEMNARSFIDLVPPLWHKYKDLHVKEDEAVYELGDDEEDIKLVSNSKMTSK